MIINEILTLPVNESSGYSLAGSFTHDLIKSKVWLLTELAKISPEVGTIYVLGSWYGNLGVLLALNPVIQYRQLINVETDQKFLQASERIHNLMGMGNTVLFTHLTLLFNCCRRRASPRGRAAARRVAGRPVPGRRCGRGRVPA